MGLYAEQQVAEPRLALLGAGEIDETVVACVMALLSFCGIGTPSLAAQGGQRLPSYFNIDRDIPVGPQG